MSSNDKEVAVDKAENNEKAGDAKAEVKGTKRAAEEKTDESKKAKKEENGEEDVDEEDEEEVEGEEEEEDEEIPEGEEEEDEEEVGEGEGDGDEDEEDAWSLYWVLHFVYIRMIRNLYKITKKRKTLEFTHPLPPNLQRLLYKFDKEQFVLKNTIFKVKRILKLVPLSYMFFVFLWLLYNYIDILFFFNLISQAKQHLLRFS